MSVVIPALLLIVGLVVGWLIGRRRTDAAPIHLSDVPVAVDARWQVDARAVCDARTSPSLLADAITMTRAGGKLRIAALYEGVVPIDANQIVQKEMSVAGTFAYRGEFSQVLQMLSSGQVTAEPLITHTFSLDQAADAFVAQMSKDTSIKVQIAP